MMPRVSVSPTAMRLIAVVFFQSGRGVSGRVQAPPVLTTSRVVISREIFLQIDSVDRSVVVSNFYLKETDLRSSIDLLS